MTEVGAPSETDPPLSLVLYLPYGDDASAVAGLLSPLGIPTSACTDPAQLETALQDHGGVLLVSQEGLTRSVLKVVEPYLEEQPRWSEMPVVLLLDDEFLSTTTVAEMQTHFPRAKLTLLERPIRNAELTSVVRSALSARERQFSVRSHMQKQEELRRELNHRVKNVLSSVQALYELTLRNSSDLKNFSEDFEGRLAALSGVHDVLFSVNYESPLLTDVVKTIVAPFQGSGRQRVILSGPADIRLQSDPAMVVAMSLHELTTNASKYGALAMAGGTIDIGWRKDRRNDADTLEFQWLERGGPNVSPPKHSGYGTSFIKSAVENRLGGNTSFEFLASGLEVRISIPADSLMAP